jgi:hypothetical protein
MQEHHNSKTKALESLLWKEQTYCQTWTCLFQTAEISDVAIS